MKPYVRRSACVVWGAFVWQICVFGCGSAPRDPVAAPPAASPERHWPSDHNSSLTLEDEPTPPSAPLDPIETALRAPDRSPEDRALDLQRKPAELLRFFKIAPRQRLAELASGGGYTTELLARVSGAEGTVFGHNSPFILERFAEGPWAERLEKPVMSHVVRVDAEFEAPLPKEATELDAVLIILFYHDTVWFKTDRVKMNAAVFLALKPGGIYGIVDHSARQGDGVTGAETLHRIEQSVVRDEVEAAGFVFDAEADFLRNRDDTRDWNAAPSAAGDRRGESDRFVLRFVKPPVAPE